MPKYTATNQSGQTITLEGDKQPTASDFDHAFAQAKQYSNRPASDSGEALLTNLPTSGTGQNLVRGLPGTLGAVVGGIAGLPGGPLGVVAGSALGGAAGEALRQGVSNLTSAAFPEQNYPVNSPRQAAGEVLGQGVSQGAGAGLGLGLGAAASAIRPGINRLGAGAMKIAAGIPEEVGLAAMRNPSILLNTPTREVVNSAYDAFHGASGTVSRKESILAGGKGSDVGRVSRAVSDLDEATAALRNGTLTEQQAVNASQAGRVVSDMKMRGNELAQETADYASSTKQSMDEFLAAPRGRRSIFPRTERAMELGGPKVRELPESPAYPEWQDAREKSYREMVGNEFGSPLPQNINGAHSTNVSRPWAGMLGGAGVGARVAGAPGAAIGGAVGLGLTSPLTYRTALQGAALVGKVPGSVYRVIPQAIAGSNSMIAQKYFEAK